MMFSVLRLVRNIELALTFKGFTLERRAVAVRFVYYLESDDCFLGIVRFISLKYYNTVIFGD